MCATRACSVSWLATRQRAGAGRVPRGALVRRTRPGRACGPGLRERARPRLYPGPPAVRAGSGMLLGAGVLPLGGGRLELGPMTSTADLHLPPGAVPVAPADFA